MTPRPQHHFHPLHRHPRRGTGLSSARRSRFR